MKKILSSVLICVLLVGTMLALVSCGGPNADPAKALAALKENGYTAAEDKYVVPTALAILGVKDIKTVISGTKKADDELETVTIIYFDDADAAKAAWEDVQDYADGEKDDEETDWVVAQSGAMIYFGTKAGVAAAK